MMRFILTICVLTVTVGHIPAQTDSLACYRGNVADWPVAMRQLVIGFQQKEAQVNHNVASCPFSLERPYRNTNSPNPLLYPRLNTAQKLLLGLDTVSLRRWHTVFRDSSLNLVQDSSIIFCYFITTWGVGGGMYYPGIAVWNHCSNRFDVLVHKNGCGYEPNDELKDIRFSINTDGLVEMQTITRKYSDYSCSPPVTTIKQTTQLYRLAPRGWQLVPTPE